MTQRKRSRSIRNAAIVGVSTALLGVTAPVTASAAGGSTTDALTWSACEGTGLDPRQECATLDVPMDYADPDGPRIEMAVSRIPAEKPDARRGALLLIAGGPGGSSLNDPSGKGQKLPRRSATPTTSSGSHRAASRRPLPPTAGWSTATSPPPGCAPGRPPTARWTGT